MLSPVERRGPSNADVEFMRSIEAEFKKETGFENRSQYKIFYSPVWPARIMLLGINPGGDPRAIAADEVNALDGGNHKASSSSAFFENGENDIIDCSWRENTGLLELLVPLLGSRNAIRAGVVKTNLSFARSRNANDKRFINDTKNASAPFLGKLLDWVNPELILLAGVKLTDFTGRYCAEFIELAPREESRTVHQTVIWPARVRLLNGRSCLAVEVSHASQFGWIYKKHDVGSKIRAIWGCG